MKKLIGMTILLLCGCVESRMNNGLHTLVGHDIHDAMRIFGYPTGQRTVMGDTVYVWSSNGQMMMPMTTTSNAYGSVGNTPYYGTSNSTSFQPMATMCTVQLAVDTNGIIKSSQWEGNMAGCNRYARAFP